MNSLKETSDTWFTEVSQFWKNQALSFKVTKILCDEKSEYQHLQVCETEAFGRVLILDGAVQCTEFDEFSYHELIANLPLCSHPNPERVLVIGGGDGGTIREAARHPGVKEIVLAELDQLVVEKSKEYFPCFRDVFADPRVKCHFGDGAAYAKAHQNYFDVIIVDSSDPVGPASVLYSAEFYSDLHASLRADGIVACQAESFWLHRDFIRQIISNGRQSFASVEYATASVPTYPSGQIGFMIMSKNGQSCKTPLREHPDPRQLRVYTKELHSAAFVLPKFALDMLS